MGLPRGKMKGKQKGSAVRIKAYTYRHRGKTIHVKAHRRGKAGGKRG